jgi:hypothetical protein
MLGYGGRGKARTGSAVSTALIAALDVLAEVDPDTLDGAELADAVVELHRQQARLAAATTRLTAVLEARRVYADDGSRSCGAWLAHHCRLPVGQARAQAWLGRRLRTMPATAEAFAAGEISQRHAAVLASLAAGRTAEFFAATRRNLSTTRDALHGRISAGRWSIGGNAPTPTGSRRTPPMPRRCGASTCLRASGARASWMGC